MEDLKNMDFDINKAYVLVSKKLESWVEFAIQMLPNFVLAIIVLLVFVFVARLVKSIIYKITIKLTDNESLRKLISSIVYISLVAIGTFIALSILELDGAVTSLLAGAGVLGLALGFAFQDIASNFIAGTMMSIRKPFTTGDLIETNDFFGKVVSIHLRTTQVETLEGQLVMIPNAEVFKKPIINYTALGKRRVDISVGVTYGEDLPFAKKVTLEAISSLEGIDKDNITIFYKEFGDSSINFTVRYWIPFSNKNFEYLAKVDEGIIVIKKAFDENNITIPFPIRTLDVGDVSFKDIFQVYNKSQGGSSSAGERT